MNWLLAPAPVLFYCFPFEKLRFLHNWFRSNATIRMRARGTSAARERGLHLYRFSTCFSFLKIVDSGLFLETVGANGTFQDQKRNIFSRNASEAVPVFWPTVPASLGVTQHVTAFGCTPTHPLAYQITARKTRKNRTRPRTPHPWKPPPWKCENVEMPKSKAKKQKHNTIRLHFTRRLAFGFFPGTCWGFWGSVGNVWGRYGAGVWGSVLVSSISAAFLLLFRRQGSQATQLARPETRLSGSGAVGVFTRKSSDTNGRKSLGGRFYF